MVMTVENILRVLVVIALIGVIMYYLLETKIQREQKDRHKIQKNISENVRFMIYGNQNSPNVALGKDNYVYILNQNTPIEKIDLDDILSIDVHYHIRADKDKNVISPSLKLDNHTFIDKLDLKISTYNQDFFIGYVPYMKHVESNEVRSKIIQMKRFKMMIEREKDEDGIVNN